MSIFFFHCFFLFFSLDNFYCSIFIFPYVLLLSLPSEFINRQGLQIYFLDTRTVQPQWPMILVCWSGTRRPQKCSLLWAQIFFSCFRSSENLSKPLATIWLYFPSFMFFCLFKNWAGILLNGGHVFHLILWALLPSWCSRCLFFSTPLSISLPHTLTCGEGKGYFHHPWILVLSTGKMCWNFSGATSVRAAGWGVGLLWKSIQWIKKKNSESIFNF